MSLAQIICLGILRACVALGIGSLVLVIFPVIVERRWPALVLAFLLTVLYFHLTHRANVANDRKVNIHHVKD